MALSYPKKCPVQKWLSLSPPYSDPNSGECHIDIGAKYRDCRMPRSSVNILHLASLYFILGKFEVLSILLVL